VEKLILPGIECTWAEIHTAEPLAPEPCALEVELAIKKSPGIDEIPAELIKLGGRTTCCEFYKLNISIWNTELSKESMYLYIRRAIKQTVVIIGAYQFCQLCTNLYPTSRSQDYLHMQRKLLGIINVYFSATGQLLIIYSVFIIYSKKLGIQ
jgi:hypothetical protein